MSDKDYMKIENDLNMLLLHGREYLVNVANAAKLLEMDYKGEIELSPDEKHEMFQIMTQTTKKHLELIQKLAQKDHDPET